MPITNTNYSFPRNYSHQKIQDESNVIGIDKRFDKDLTNRQQETLTESKGLIPLLQNAIKHLDKNHHDAFSLAKIFNGRDNISKAPCNFNYSPEEQKSLEDNKGTLNILIGNQYFFKDDHTKLSDKLQSIINRISGSEEEKPLKVLNTNGDHISNPSRETTEVRIRPLENAEKPPFMAYEEKVEPKPENPKINPSMINNKEYLNIKNKQYLPTNKGVWAAKAALTAQIEKQQEIEASPQENKALPKKKPYMVSQANIPEELNSEANNFPNESENNLSEIKVIVTPPEDSYLDRIFSPSKIDDGGELRDSQYEKLFTSALQNNPAPSEEK